MTESDLLAAHTQQPLAARWFSLASYCLAHGYEIKTYAPQQFEAEMVTADNDLESAFLATIEPNGSARWTWWWADEDEPDEDDLKEDHGHSESFALVLVDWVRTAFPD